MRGSWTLLIMVLHIASFGGAARAQMLDDEKQRCFVDHSDAERSPLITTSRPRVKSIR